MGIVKSGIQKIRDGDIEGISEVSVEPKTAGTVKSGIQKIQDGEVPGIVKYYVEGWDGALDVIVNGEDSDYETGLEELEEDADPKEAED